jgi:hypothetical protein
VDCLWITHIPMTKNGDDGFNSRAIGEELYLQKRFPAKLFKNASAVAVTTINPEL